MLAYTKGITKKQFVKEIKAHQKADNFLKGTYDEGQKGCAVGCSLKSVAKLKGIKLSFNNHKEYENHLGIPEWLAKLEDTIFEGVSLERSKVWPVEFAESISEGADLNQVKVPFIVYLMEENLKSIRSVKYDADAFPHVKSAIEKTEKAVLQIIEAQTLGDKEQIAAAESAASAAESAAWLAARSAARLAARSAAESAASAARSAARSARSAARSAAESAARSAAESAASAARSAAESAAYGRHADKLLELLRDCK